MTWFNNHYECSECDCRWQDEWLTHIVKTKGEMFVVLQSPESAEHDPAYREIVQFETMKEATDFLSSCAD